MVKYGKKFRNSQISGWQDKYLSYKNFKQIIKKHVEERSKDKDFINPEVGVELDKKVKEFTDELDKDIKKVYIFFTNKEKKLYKDINKYLHEKDDYPDYDLGEYVSQFRNIFELSNFSLNLSKFVFYNLKAVLKILKKFDKKVIYPIDKTNLIKNNYIQTKLEEQNSDILYMFKFKMIDEVNVIMEDLIKCLKEEFQNNKKRLKEESEKSKKKFSQKQKDKEENDNEKKLVISSSEDEEKNKINNSNDENEKELDINEDEQIDFNEALDTIDHYYKEIKVNIKKIDFAAMAVIKLFEPWKSFLRISSDVSSKLMQLNKEFSFSDCSFGDDGALYRKRSISIVDNISFSVENKKNIYITLFHGFLYMFSFSIIIPTYMHYIDKFKEEKYFYGLLMMMVPIGALVGYFYETFFFKLSTKIPLIVSCVELIIGNILYGIAFKVDIFAFLFVGRILVGMSNLRSHNKMYIINYLSRKDVSYYLTMFHASSIFGLSSGFLVNALYNENIFKNFCSNDICNQRTLGSFFVSLLALIQLFFLIFLYSEAKSKKFKKVTMSMIDNSLASSLIPSGNQQEEKEQNKEKEKEKEKKSEKASRNNTVGEKEFSEQVNNDENMIQNIDIQLENFNKQSNFDDTNLVTKSIHELASKEKGGLQRLKKAFIVYLFIIFTTKFIIESMFVYFPLNFYLFDNISSYSWLIPIVLGVSCFLVLLAELSLSKKNACSEDKILLIIILTLNLINSGCFIKVAQSFYIVYIINTCLALILSNLIEKTSSHYFFNVIPHHYNICKIQGNVIINILSTMARIISCGLLVMYQKDKDGSFNFYYYLTMTILSGLSLILYLIFYSEIRVKAISRIIKTIGKDEVKIATAV